MQREYRLNKKSPKYKDLEITYQSKLKKSKKKFKKRVIDDIKNSNKSQWYSKLKWISSYDQQKKEDVFVDEINHLTNREQGEAIADSLSAVSNEYSKLRTEDIDFEPFTQDDIPQFTKEAIHCLLENIKTKKSSVIGDIPAIVIKECSQYLCIPMMNT